MRAVSIDSGVRIGRYRRQYQPVLILAAFTASPESWQCQKSSGEAIERKHAIDDTSLSKWRVYLIAGRCLALTIIALLTCQLNAAAANLKHPDWHPNGHLLVAEGSCLGGSDLFLIDLQSETVRMIFDGGLDEGYPRWFSGGDRLAFHQIDAQGRARLYVADVDQGGKFSNTRRLTNGPFDIEPAPSPAGQTIAFSRPGADGQDIALVDIATRKLTRIFETAAAENFPSWNPDGTAVLFHARDDAGTQVYLRDRKTSEVTQLTEGAGPNMVADMSSDAELLAYSSERSGDREIFIRKLADNSDRQVTDRAGRDGYPKFSPDDRMLAYHSEIDADHTVVRVLDLDTDQTREYSCQMAIDR